MSAIDELYESIAKLHDDKKISVDEYIHIQCLISDSQTETANEVLCRVRKENETLKGMINNGQKPGASGRSRRCGGKPA